MQRSVILLFLLSCNLSHAADVLADITARLIKTSITQGEFQQEKRLKILRKPLLSSGEFTYSQSKGVIWKTLSPVSSILLVNKTHLVSSQGEQLIPATFGSVFQAMLGGDLTQLREDFIITAKEGSTWQLQLQPKEAMLQKIIQSIELSGDNEVRSVVIKETSGNSSQISFSHIEHPTHTTPEQAANFEHLSP